jgi:hypothetical protein
MHALSVWEVIWRVVVEMDPLLSETRTLESVNGLVSTHGERLFERPGDT